MNFEALYESGQEWYCERVKKDINQTAYEIVKRATEKEEGRFSIVETKNPAAVALGRLGGLKGGKARAKKLSAKRRKEIARKAINARWKKNS